MSRRSEGGNPLSVESLAAETERGSDYISQLETKLERYARAKYRGLAMTDYIASVQHQTTDTQNVASRLHECGSYLVFRHYLTEKRARLIAARTCKQHLICPFCAIRRGAKMQVAYAEKVQHLLTENPALVPWMVTFTVKNGDDLNERYSHLHRSVKAMNKNRTRGDRGHEIMKAVGSVWSYEFKRGSGSGLWHPHMHAVWLCSSPLDVQKLSDEWRHITGDSFIIDAHPMYGDPVEAFCEVFKYAVKFNELPLVDNWHAFNTLRRKRLIRSAGILWGVEMPESDMDEELDDPVFADFVYRYFHEQDAYKVCEHRTSLNTPPDAYRPKGRLPMIVDNKPYVSLHLRQLQRKYG
jgi:hypothetical protein